MKTAEQILDKIKIIERTIENLQLNCNGSRVIKTQIHYYKEEVKLLKWVLN